MAAVFALVLIAAACGNATDDRMEDTGAAKEAVTEETQMQDSAESDDMQSDDMKDEAMKDEAMKDDDMKDEDMKDEDMKDDEMKDEAMDEGHEAMDEEPMMTNEGPMAPEFELEDLDGKVHRLSDYKGRKVYLKYWASWCSICLAGLEEVDELFATTDDYVVFTVVTPDANGEKSKEDFVEWFDGLEYDNINVLFDDKGAIGKQLGIRAFPTSVFIGSDGVLIETRPGHKSNQQIDEMVEAFY